MSKNTSGGYKELRSMMIKNQLKARNITDKKVLKAISEVPREEFVPKKYIEFAYSDKPLPIESGQTISQPYVVARMCQLLELTGNENVLDVGVGSGYQAAVLSRIVKKVTAIDIKKNLVKKAKKTTERLGYKNIEILEHDANLGYEPNAPYDAIKSAAASSEIPESWKIQLTEGGRIVAPERQGMEQRLVRLTKLSNDFKKEVFETVQFVPLLSLIKDKSENENAERR